MRLVERYSGERIRRNVAYCEKQAQKSPIDNRPAYLMKAIEGDFQPGPTAREIATAEKARDIAQKAAAATAVKAQASQDQKDFEDFQYTRTREIFVSRSKSWQDKRRKDFRDNPPTGSSLVRELIGKGEWESPVVSAVFFGKLRSELLREPHELHLDKYVAWKQSQPA